MSRLERDYQAALKKRIQTLLPGCLIVKQDANQTQGILDLLILHNDRWAMLEVKASADAPHRPNQDYYVEKFAGMSFAAFIYPENEQEVLNALQRALQNRCERVSRLS